MRRLLLATLTLVAVTLAASVAEADATSTVAERRAGAKAITRLTFAFARERSASDWAAQRAARQRRAAAGTCLDLWKSVPPPRLEAVGELYFGSVAGALWSVDGPPTERWVTRLAAARSIMRVPVLAAAVRGMRRTLPLFTAAISAFPDPCATVRAWQEAGWTAAARPLPIGDLEVAARAAEAGQRAVERGAALVRRYGGASGQNAAALLGGALDEIDSRVIEDCDPVARIVLPDNVGTCAHG